MHDLVQIDPAPPGSLTVAEIDATMAYATAEKSAATRAAYATDWRDFTTWCLARGATPLPAHVGIVGVYLSHLATSGLKASTIGRRAAGVGYFHLIAGHESPISSQAVKAVLRGIRRTLGTVPVRKAPATADIIAKMMATCPDKLIGARDKALLAFGFAGAFRRSELLALRVEDLAEVADGLRVTIRRSKTDQEGAGQEIAIPRGYHLRPVEHVQAWLAAAAIGNGPVFRSVAVGGRVFPVALGDDAYIRMIKRKAKAIGLDPALYSGHSLRSGFITSAAEAGESALKMVEVSRHRSLETLSGYVRRSDLFREHAGRTFL